MALLTCDRVSLSYDNYKVINDLSFSVEGGDYLCIVGENGSGKSTLIRALLGLKAPSSGRILYGDGLAGNEIGYLPQKNEMQKDFPASVWEVVLSGRLNRHPVLSFYSKADREAAEENLSRLGILALRDRSFAELSGGQQQRVLLARALCATGKLILLDEPVTGLDPSATAELYAVIRRINQAGITVIMVSHDLHGCLRYATKVLQLQGDSYSVCSPAAFLTGAKRVAGGRQDHV